MARRRLSPINLSFLDAMTCGFGAVILFFMIINASVGVRADRVTLDRRAEVNLLEEEVLEGFENLVVLRNSLREVEDQQVTAQGLSAEMVRTLKEIQVELARLDKTTMARSEHRNQLQADLRSLEEGAKRLAAATPVDAPQGDRLRSFIGDGRRQYLTGLKVSGKRTFILVDASASMLGDTIVNIIRRRNLPDEVKVQSDKWQQALATVDWLATQIPQDGLFQIYTFGETATSTTAGSNENWLDGSKRQVLDAAMEGLRAVVPRGGTSLIEGFKAVAAMDPRPDNLILLVDSLPTWGESAPKSRTISPKQRLRFFDQAISAHRPRMPVNVILFPMEGDPLAASAYWKLAIATGGSFLSPPGDWP